MFKGFQDNSALQQFHGFPNLNMQQATSAYGFSGVTFWLDAAYGLNTQTNFGAVSSWQQRVGGGTYVQATAGDQPRLVLNDANYNNLPSVESLNAVNDFMIANTGLKLGTSYTVAIVAKANTIGNNSQCVIGFNQSNTPGFILGGNRGTTTGIGFTTDVDTISPALQGTTESTNARIHIITNTNIVVNGINEVTGTGASRPIELTQIFRGGSIPGGVPLNPLIGSIAEIIAFGYSMTSDEAIALSNNINQKYALY